MYFEFINNFKNYKNYKKISNYINIYYKNLYYKVYIISY